MQGDVAMAMVSMEQCVHSTVHRANTHSTPYWHGHDADRTTEESADDTNERIEREQLRAQRTRRRRVSARARGQGWKHQRGEHRDARSSFLRVRERIHGKRFSRIIKQGLKRMRKGVAGGGL